MPDAPQVTIEFEATVRSIEPRIWRRFRLPGNLRVSDLHSALQLLFGWDDSHLHEFRGAKGRVVYAPPSPDDLPIRPVIDSARTPLSAVFKKKGDALLYNYDFGDNWEVDVRAAAVVEGYHPPRCLAGERNGPPEDCGGVHGYADLLEDLADTPPEDREDTLECGADYDPEHFDLPSTNEALQKMFRSSV
ncbi:MAG TPA: plasmid pRiA4b ORF-3 family protein [Planctomycetota bacterium]|nr:plasmid pRiA4b ORF-3 family protein [Planctomycetota bacterium]